MKTIPKFGVALLVLASALSCKESGPRDEATASEESSASAGLPDQTAVSSSAAVVQKTDRKFIRTADIRFRTKDVAKSTYSIENAVTKFGGFVTNTELKSTIAEQNEVQVSPDSTLQTTKYNVGNSMTIRVPNTKLDTVVKLIARQVEFLDSRTIKADDATLKLLSNELANLRSDEHKKRMENAIDKAPRKLNDISNAENDLLDKQTNADSGKIDNLAMNDQVNFSTITLDIYQREVIAQELLANEKSVNAYRPHIGLQIWDSLKTGWFILEAILAFIAKLWSLLLIAAIAYLLHRKYIKKAKAIL
ncbi:MAG: DUF4349 domain-containing protein [Flavobacterium sp.]|nr:MAG: DUF4349 domain-containing protein [Flavobacterium sp.]